MKEGGGQMQGEKAGTAMIGGGSSNTRSAIDKEKTKMRERQRRSVTTKIFHGLRKHGGYRLSPRADINEVLRELAKEAGWVVEPDGTTYRASTTNVSNVCPRCGAGKGSGTPTPTSSIIGGGGECSATASPCRITAGDSMLGFGRPNSLYYCGGVSSCGSGGGGVSPSQDLDIPLAMYMYGRIASGINQHSAAAATGVVGSSTVTPAYSQQQLCLQEANVSNQNSPVVSPRRRA
ncbi:hypothetical protein F0562_018020 [Nyssa sinensis]|uniref:Protein BZR1 homolog n=1 Tax=Nyssa sinensis TaxID=561372 RepID=A0A5J4ZC68_9ASTE|nr:hypothetical protein F0562_018020 [Nyssa sinensis]